MSIRELMINSCSGVEFCNMGRVCVQCVQFSNLIRLNRYAIAESLHCLVLHIFPRTDFIIAAAKQEAAWTDRQTPV